MKLELEPTLIPKENEKNLEVTSENKDLFNELKKLNSKERELYIFKLFYNGLDRETGEKLKNINHNHPFMLKNFSFVAGEALESREIKTAEYYNRYKCCPEITQTYKTLLKKMFHLAKELNISNSLELSILFSYLLWEGYLSKTKKHTFEEKDRKIIPGLLVADITDGIGVCLNYSEMLKDFLNYSGYNATILANHFDNNTRIDYKMNVRRFNQYSYNFSESVFQRKKANHAFNLIEEDNKLYIYDPTNLLLYNIVNSDYATLANGKGKNKLFPYQSYSFCISSEDITLLDKLFKLDTFISPYTKTDFRSISEVNIEIIKNRTSLLEDFYVEVRPDILSISEETDKIIKRRTK